MAQIADFERHVLPFAVNAPAPAVEDAVLDACIDFCIRTRVLREFLDPITILPNVAEYEIDAPDMNSQVVDVAGLWLPEGSIDPLTRVELDAHYPQGWATLSVGRTADVKGFHCRLPGFLRLVPYLTVRVDRAMSIEIAIAPSRKTTTVADVLFNRYAEVIAAGALSRLHQHPASYADPSRVATYTQSFENAISVLADDSNRGFARKQLRTAPERP